MKNRFGDALTGERRSVPLNLLFFAKLLNEKVDHIYEGNTNDGGTNQKHGQICFSGDKIVDGVGQHSGHQDQGGQNFGHRIHGKVPPVELCKNYNYLSKFCQGTTKEKMKNLHLC